MDLFKHDADLMLRPKKNGYRHLLRLAPQLSLSIFFVDFPRRFRGSPDSFFLKGKMNHGETMSADFLTTNRHKSYKPNKENMRTIALLAAIGAASAFAPAGVLPSRFSPAPPCALNTRRARSLSQVVSSPCSIRTIAKARPDR